MVVVVQWPPPACGRGTVPRVWRDQTFGTPASSQLVHTPLASPHHHTSPGWGKSTYSDHCMHTIVQSNLVNLPFENHLRLLTESYEGVKRYLTWSFPNSFSCSSRVWVYDSERNCYSLMEKLGKRSGWRRCQLGIRFSWIPGNSATELPSDLVSQLVSFTEFGIYSGYIVYDTQK